jgi:hypothetical protein
MHGTISCSSDMSGALTHLRLSPLADFPEMQPPGAGHTVLQGVTPPQIRQDVTRAGGNVCRPLTASLLNVRQHALSLSVAPSFPTHACCQVTLRCNARLCLHCCTVRLRMHHCTAWLCMQHICACQHHTPRSHDRQNWSPQIQHEAIYMWGLRPGPHCAPSHHNHISTASNSVSSGIPTSSALL